MESMSLFKSGKSIFLNIQKDRISLSTFVGGFKKGNKNMNKEWTQIENQQDIDNLMDAFDCFHDSCLKELKYISGMYVEKESKGMAAVNDKREVHVIIQRQWAPYVLEMIFEKIVCMGLKPQDDDYDGVIYDAHITKENGYWVWFDSTDFKDDYREMYNYSNVTFIKAKKIKWRFNDELLGEDDFFVMKQ